MNGGQNLFPGKRVLVTGGTGFVGKCLQDEFAVSAPDCDVVIPAEPLRIPNLADISYGI